MPLTVVRRKSSGALTITGTVAGRRIRRRAQSDDPKLAEEEAAALEAELLRTAWHGERRGSRTFAEAALSYLERHRARCTPKTMCAGYCWASVARRVSDRSIKTLPTPHTA
jgi:hypothetical protein